MIYTEKQQLVAKLHRLGYHLEPEERVIDIVCGMELKRAECVTKYVHQSYYFCSWHCKNHFDSNPEMYAGERIK